MSDAIFLDILIINAVKTQKAYDCVKPQTKKPANRNAIALQ